MLPLFMKKKKLKKVPWKNGMFQTYITRFMKHTQFKDKALI